MMMLQKGPISLRETAQKLGVCEMTLRRDLRLLESQKHCILTKGGAIMHPANYSLHTDGTDDLEYTKHRIAEKLFQRIFPCENLFIGSGSTNLALARYIALNNTRPLTIITNALPVAAALFQSGNQVILLGGSLRSTSLDLTGPVAEKNLQEYHVDWLITGCDGAAVYSGFYTSDMRLCDLERSSISIADHVAVITDSSKFGRESVVRFATLDEIDLLVTDGGLTEGDREILCASGVEVLTV